MATTLSPSQDRLATLLVPSAKANASKGRALMTQTEADRTAHLLTQQKREVQTERFNFPRRELSLDRTYLDDIIHPQGMYFIKGDELFMCEGIGDGFSSDSDIYIAYNGGHMRFVTGGSCSHYDSLMRKKIGPLINTHRKKVLADIEGEGASLVNELDSVIVETSGHSFLPRYLLENVLKFNDAAETGDTKRRDLALTISEDLKRVAQKEESARAEQERTFPYYNTFITKHHPEAQACLFFLGNVYGLARNPHRGEELESLITNASFVQSHKLFTQSFARMVQETCTKEIYTRLDEQIRTLAHAKTRAKELHKSSPVHEAYEIGAWGYNKIDAKSYVVYKKLSPFILKRDDDHALYSNIKVGVVVNQREQSLNLATESFIYDPIKEDTFEHPFKIGGVTLKEVYLGPLLCNGGHNRSITGKVPIHHSSIALQNLQEERFPEMVREEILVTERKLKYGFKREYDYHKIGKHYKNYLSCEQARELARTGVIVCDNPSE